MSNDLNHITENLTAIYWGGGGIGGVLGFAYVYHSGIILEFSTIYYCAHYAISRTSILVLRVVASQVAKLTYAQCTFFEFAQSSAIVWYLIPWV